jgi:geranylgeranylglycerol-phosphate geranylgeranyltransferase
MIATLTQKTKGIVQILRPELPFAAGACVVLGEVVALGSFPSLREIALGFACGFFISGSAIILNDYFDLEVDKVNTPDRPLPAGLLTPREAIGLSIITVGIGLSVSFFISISAFLLCTLFWIISVLYNWKFKEAGLLGNLMVSSSVGITFVLGGMAAGEPWDRIVWCFALMAFFIDLGEEIAGDVMDMDGDRLRGSRSIAIRMGKEFALVVSMTCFATVIVISFVPLFLGWMSFSYLVLIGITDLFIIVFAVRLWRSTTPQEGRQAMRGIYLGALLAVIAVILGQVMHV